MRIVNRGELSVDRMAELQTAIPDHENLKDLMSWALANPNDFTPTVVADVIVQDEFTHDVIVPWGNLILVYDTT